jgi:hypothetical protein
MELLPFLTYQFDGFESVFDLEKLTVWREDCDGSIVGHYKDIFYNFNELNLTRRVFQEDQGNGQFDQRGSVHWGECQEEQVAVFEGCFLGDEFDLGALEAG